MPERRNRQWLLARRPKGPVSAEDFRWAVTAAPEPAEGEALVRTLYLSIDPTQRGWMAVDTYMPAVRIGEPMRSIAVGEVVASRHPALRPGQIVQGLFGWQDYALARAGTPAAATPIVPGVPIETAMSALGLTGLTAYFGLLEIGRPKKGEAVVVSAAAGATGSVVGQIARLVGCKVIGIAGGPEKCRRLVESLGFDAAIDYRSEDVAARLRETCPAGVDVYFDNVGGAILDAALANLAMRGRVVVCGAIASYNDPAGPPGPRNYLNLIIKRGRMEGFLVMDFAPRFPEAVARLAEWLREGQLKDEVDVVDGLENAPAALARIFTGANRGKQLVRVAAPGSA